MDISEFTDRLTQSPLATCAAIYSDLQRISTKIADHNIDESNGDRFLE